AVAPFSRSFLVRNWLTEAISTAEEPMVCLTLRWRGVDSKIQFRDASPPAKQRGHLYFGGEWRLLGPPKQLYRFAEADDRSDDSAAPTVDRPQPDPSLETARDGEGEGGWVEVRGALGEHRGKGSAPDGDSRA